PYTTLFRSRYHLGSELQPGIGGSMLNGVTAFVGSNRSGCYATPMVNVGTQIHRFIHRIVMVGQHPVYRLHPHIENTVIAEHFFSYFLSTQPNSQAYLGILLEFTL